jgi:polyisoprenoid-binding protein YceI
MTTAIATALSAGTWVADAVHTDISFKARHMGVGKVRGTFELASATLQVGAGGIGDATVTVEIDAATVDTKNDQRTAHVRSADFLDIENFPTLTFVSKSVKDFAGEEFVLVGDLTIRDVTREVELAVEFLGEGEDAYGQTRAGFSATTSISRRDYNVSFNAVFGAGNSVVGDKVDIALELEFVKNA